MDKKEDKNIRFTQRFSNLEKAYTQLMLALERDTTHDPIVRSGLIKTFEFTFELIWKTMKDRLEYDGIIAASPREVIKQAFVAGYITDGAAWLDMLEKRNLMAYTYDEALSKEAESLIRNTFTPRVTEVYVYFKKLI
jgi:nucleotidyltransferase substrate binding protein (TIGR01987 family)